MTSTRCLPSSGLRARTSSTDTRRPSREPSATSPIRRDGSWSCGKPPRSSALHVEARADGEGVEVELRVLEVVQIEAREHVELVAGREQRADLKRDVVSAKDRCVRVFDADRQELRRQVNV